MPSPQRVTLGSGGCRPPPPSECSRFSCPPTPQSNPRPLLRQETRRRSTHLAAGSLRRKRRDAQHLKYETAGTEGSARLGEAPGPARVLIARHHAARQAAARPHPRSHHSQQQRRMRGACCEDPQADGGAARRTATSGLGCALWARALLPGRSAALLLGWPSTMQPASFTQANLRPCSAARQTSGRAICAQVGDSKRELHARKGMWRGALDAKVWQAHMGFGVALFEALRPRATGGLRPSRSKVKSGAGRNSTFPDGAAALALDPATRQTRKLALYPLEQSVQEVTFLLPRRCACLVIVPLFGPPRS